MNDKDLLKGLNDLKIFLSGHNYVNVYANNALEYCIKHHSSECQMQTLVSLPSDDEINFVAGEESQKDWNDLRYKDVYADGFIDGAGWMRRRAKGN